MTVGLGDWLTRLWQQLHLAGRTIRLRLTLLYGGLFLASGAVLLTITYFLVAHRYRGNFFVVAGNTGDIAGGAIGIVGGDPSTTGGAPDPQQLLTLAHAQSNAALHQLLIQSGIALAIMAMISIWLGWLVAGRVLNPLRTITNAARNISASNLHERLALQGPDDELKQLANTFDGLLERLETSFDAQRQFVANASHELRTPLTLERTLIEVALADPNADVDSLRRACEQVLRAGAQQERLIEALLTLSRSQRGLDRHEPVDLAALTADALAAMEPNGVTIETALGAAATSGDPRLVERLVSNLLDNAVRHNVAHGYVKVATSTGARSAILSVTNSGPVVPAGEIDRLFQPFQRLDGYRAGQADGLGLGLSIVQAIANGHAATVTTRAQTDGGFHIEVQFRGADSDKRNDSH